MKHRDNLVCDQCGCDEGTCYHTHDSDYMIEPRWKFQRGMVIFRCFSMGMILSLAIIGGIIAYIRS
jgi:hypothetical protein